jgi:hypothetical protein
MMDILLTLTNNIQKSRMKRICEGGLYLKYDHDKQVFFVHRGEREVIGNMSLSYVERTVIYQAYYPEDESKKWLSSESNLSEVSLQTVPQPEQKEPVSSEVSGKRMSYQDQIKKYGFVDGAKKMREQGIKAVIL